MAGRRLVSAWRCSLPVVDPPFPQEPVRARVVENPAAFAARSGREVVVGPLDAPSTSMFANLRPSGRSVLGRAAFVPGGRNMHTEHPARRTQVRTPQDSSSRTGPSSLLGGVAPAVDAPGAGESPRLAFFVFSCHPPGLFCPGGTGGACCVSRAGSAPVCGWFCPCLGGGKSNNISWTWFLRSFCRKRQNMPASRVSTAATAPCIKAVRGAQAPAVLIIQIQNLQV